MVRAPAIAVPESVPCTKVAVMLPSFTVTLVALFALMYNMSMAARLGALPITNDGVVAEVTPHLKPELTALSKSTPTGLTVIGTVVLQVRPPPTPVMVKVYEATGVLALVVMVSMDDPVAGFGLNVPVAPEGSPLTLKSTGLLKPYIGVMVRLELAEPPCAGVRLDGEKLNAKFGVFTMSVTKLLRVKEPLAPVTVSV